MTAERSLLLTDDAEVTAIAELAAERGWPITYNNYSGHGEYAQTLWRVSEGTRLRYLEHHTSGTRLITVDGESEQEVTETAAAAAETVPVTRVDELLDFLTGATDPAPVELVRAFRRLSAAHYIDRVTAAEPGPLDPRYLAAVERHAAHPHRQVRLTVMLVVDELSALWPELTAPIVARHGLETDHADLVEAFVEVARPQA